MRKALFFIVALLTASTAWALNTLTVGDYTFATGSDAEGEYYVVSDTTALNALARYVNSGNNASGKRFKQTANITYTHSTAWNDAASTENNFTGIGSMNMPFSGTFDGGGFTISGIRIYKDGTSNDNSYKGLIGNIEDAAAVVKNVTLADARITGHYDVGGIVGYLKYGTVSNCRVTSNVVIHRVQEYSSDHGGITGSASISATVMDCISAATLTDGRGVGAITGSCPSSNVTLLRNYYIYTTCKGIGLVSGSEDRTANDGAVPARFTQSGNTFTIDDASGWEAFCLFLVDGETFSGKTVKLGADISVSRMAGSGDSTPFGGTFDGDGHTLTFNYSGSEDFIAPFSWTTWTNSPIFRNLTVSGTINTTGAYAAGLVGHLFGTVTVEHCTSNVDITCASGGSGFVGLCEHTVNFSDCLSSAVIHSKGGNNSGFVGWSRASGYAISFTGCVFNGKLLQIDGEGGINGGFIGWTGSNKTVTITDCLVNTAALADGETMASGSTATFARGWNATTTATNSYYTAALGAPQCTQARSITAGENVTTLENAGTPATVYNVSGITAYPTGIKYNDVLYAGNDETVNLTLGYYDREGFIFSGYEASAGTLNGSANPYTLTMPDEDVEIGATFKPLPFVTYIDENGDEQSTYAFPFEGGDNLASGWYFVGEDTTFTSMINFTGDVHLIIGDGATLTVDAGITINDGNGALAIYGQHEGSGKLNVNGKDGYPGSVSHNNGENGAHGISGHITVNGGLVTVNGGDGGQGGPFTSTGHGGHGGHGINGTLTVNRGSVTVNGGNGGRGAQYNFSPNNGGDGGDAINGTLTVNRGSVLANGGKGGQKNSLSSSAHVGLNGRGVRGTVTAVEPIIIQDSDDGDTWSNMDSGSTSEKRYVRVKLPALRGDVNGDNAVNIADVTALIDILLSDTTAPAAADCNHDNAVNIADVTSLIDYLLGGTWP